MMGVELAQSVRVCACVCAGVRAGMCVCVCVSGTECSTHGVQTWEFYSDCGV